MRDIASPLDGLGSSVSFGPSLPHPLLREASFLAMYDRQAYWQGDSSGLTQACAFDDLHDFSRAGTADASYFDAAGTMQFVGANIPRFEYDPLTGARKGLLIEPQQTNLLTYNRAFDNAAWVKAGLTIAPNAETAPDGTPTADKWVEDETTGTHFIRPLSNVSVSAGSTSAFSIYVKAAGRSAVFVQLDDGTSTNQVRGQFDIENVSAGSAGYVGAGAGGAIDIEAAGNGYVKISLSGAPSPSATTHRVIVYMQNPFGTSSYTGDGTSGLYLWGASLVPGPYAGSLIKTDATTATRSADLFEVKPAVVADVLSPTEGAVLLKVDVLASNSGILWHLSDGTTNNDIRIYLTGAGNIAARVRTGGVDQANFIISMGGLVVPAGPLKIALSWSADGVFGCVNGDAVQSDLSVTVPPGLNQMRCGHFVGGTSVCAAHFEETGLFPAKRSTVELQAITS